MNPVPRSSWKQSVEVLHEGLGGHRKHPLPANHHHSDQMMRAAVGIGLITFAGSLCNTRQALVLPYFNGPCTYSCTFFCMTAGCCEGSGISKSNKAQLFQASLWKSPVCLSGQISFLFITHVMCAAVVRCSTCL